MFYEQLFTDVILHTSIKKDSFRDKISQSPHKSIAACIYYDDGYLIKGTCRCWGVAILIWQIQLTAKKTARCAVIFVGFHQRNLAIMSLG